MKIKTFLSSADFFEYLFCEICRGDMGVYCEWFKETERRIKYFHNDSSLWRDDIFVVALDGEKIIGCLNYCITKKETTVQGDRHFLSFVSVDGEYRQMGVMTALLAAWKPLIITDKGVCGCSGFTKLGFDYLRPKLLQMGVKCRGSVEF